MIDEHVEQAKAQIPDEVDKDDDDDDVAEVFGIQSQSLEPPFPVKQRSFDVEKKESDELELLFCFAQRVRHLLFSESHMQSSCLLLHRVSFPSKMWQESVQKIVDMLMEREDDGVHRPDDSKFEQKEVTVMLLEELLLLLLP